MPIQGSPWDKRKKIHPGTKTVIWYLFFHVGLRIFNPLYAIHDYRRLVKLVLNFTKMFEIKLFILEYEVYFLFFRE